MPSVSTTQISWEERNYGRKRGEKHSMFLAQYVHMHIRSLRDQPHDVMHISCLVVGNLIINAL